MKILHVAIYSLAVSLIVIGFSWFVTTHYSKVEKPISLDTTELVNVKDIQYAVPEESKTSEAALSDEAKSEYAGFYAVDQYSDAVLDTYSESTIDTIEHDKQVYYEEPISEQINGSATQRFDWSGYSTYHPTDGLTPQGGINFYDNGSGERLETAYSSNVLYHYRTSEWIVDSDGFYHDVDGRYIVAASDLAQGTVFETSRGEAIVLDSGCNPGVTDFYVNW